MQRLSDLIDNAENNTYNIDEFFNQARALAFEKYDCPLCKETFLSRLECTEHLELSHPAYRDQRPLFCDVGFFKILMGIIFITNTNVGI